MAASQYLPGAGWRLAGVHDDGSVWDEVIIAWEFRNGVGSAVVAEPGSLTVGADLPGNEGYWLVAPGEDPATARCRLEPRP